MPQVVVARDDKPEPADVQEFPSLLQAQAYASDRRQQLSYAGYRADYMSTGFYCTRAFDDVGIWIEIVP